MDLAMILPELSPGLALYLCSVALLGGWALIRVHRWLTRSTQQRRSRLLRWRVFEPVGDREVHQAELEAERKGALERIESDFTVTRRLLLPLLGVVIALALSIPFLERVSATSLSLIVGALTVLTGIAARPVVENLIAGLVSKRYGLEPDE